MLALAFVSCQKNNDVQEEQKQEEALAHYSLRWNTDGKIIANKVLMNSDNYVYCDVVIKEYNSRWEYTGCQYIEKVQRGSAYKLTAAHKTSVYATVAVKLYLQYGSVTSHIQWYVDDSYRLSDSVILYGDEQYTSEDPAYKKR